MEIVPRLRRVEDTLRNTHPESSAISQVACWTPGGSFAQDLVFQSHLVPVFTGQHSWLDKILDFGRVMSHRVGSCIETALQILAADTPRS